MWAAVTARTASAGCWVDLGMSRVLLGTCSTGRCLRLGSARFRCLGRGSAQRSAVTEDHFRLECARTTSVKLDVSEVARIREDSHAEIRRAMSGDNALDGAPAQSSASELLSELEGENRLDRLADRQTKMIVDRLDPTAWQRFTSDRSRRRQRASRRSPKPRTRLDADTRRPRATKRDELEAKERRRELGLSDVDEALLRQLAERHRSG